MPFDHYVHPEFGYLAPTSRFRRELRVGLISMAIGLVFGVIAPIALNVSLRHPEGGSLSSAEIRGAVAGAATTVQAPPDGKFSKSIGAVSINTNAAATPSEANTKNAGMSDSTVDDGGSSGAPKPPLNPKPRAKALGGSLADAPPIARLPLGRSDPTSGLIPSDAQADKNGTRGHRGAMGLEQPPGRAFQHDETAAAPIPLPRKRPEKTARRTNPASDFFRSREEGGNDLTDGDTTKRAARVGPAYVRDSSPSLKGFWAWSW
jgi:hypothetical protein